MYSCTSNNLVLLHQKASRRFEGEQEEFNRRRLKHNTQLAEIERQEILRREDALSRINNKLDELRKRHKGMESVYENQVTSKLRY